MIEIRIAPLTCRTYSTTIRSRPSTKTSTGQPCERAADAEPDRDRVPAASGLRRTKPASTRPISAMNRPMPTLIAILSCAGTAWNTAVRKPVSTSTRMTSPSSTTRPIASAQRHLGGDRERDERVEAEPGGERQREVGDHAHQDRQHAGDQRGGRGDRREVRRAPAAEELPVAVLREAEDERVEHDDVGHREERDDAAADLAADGRATLGDLEEPVQMGRSAELRSVVWVTVHGCPECVVTGGGSAGRPPGHAADILPERWPSRCTRSPAWTRFGAVDPDDDDPADRGQDPRDRQAHLHRRRRRPARRRRRAHRRGRHRAVAARVRAAAAVLRPARGERPRLVAVDLPGRLRPGRHRLGLLPAAAQGQAAGHAVPGPPVDQN